MSTGRVKILSQQIGAAMAMAQGDYVINLMHERNRLLTNDHKPPIPFRVLNQRQKRKRARHIS